MTESERRRAPRRNLPFLRGASLETGGRTHVVVITDLGPEGAFLSTRAPIEVEDPLRLRMLMPGENREVLLRCRLVRRNERFDPATGRPAGLAVCSRTSSQRSRARWRLSPAPPCCPAPRPDPPSRWSTGGAGNARSSKTGRHTSARGAGTT